MVGKVKDKIKNPKFNTDSHPTRNDIYEVGWEFELIIESLSFRNSFPPIQIKQKGRVK